MSPRHFAKMMYGPYFLSDTHPDQKQVQIEADIEERAKKFWHILLKPFSKFTKS
jgi:hypothetical protein